MDKKSAKQTVELYQKILKELKIPMDTDCKILDFGCGNGSLVYQLRQVGLTAFGVDVIDDFGQEFENWKINKNYSEDIYRKIDLKNYSIPFEDNTFDLIFSNQVFEHVQNFSESIREIHRVLKPGGYSLHMFPSKYRPVEPHIYVPLAGIFQGYYYLLLWAYVGIKNEFQTGLKPKIVAKKNFEYLKSSTNYLSTTKIQSYFTEYFEEVDFIENLFIEHSPGRIRLLSSLTHIFPFIPFVVRNFHERVILVKKSQSINSQVQDLNTGL